MNIDNNILSNGKELQPCPECGNSNFLIERSTHSRTLDCTKKRS